MEDILKLGAVVRIENYVDDIMIIGYYPEEIETGCVYTYLGINASVGMSIRQDAVFFNQDKITKVLYEGFSDEKSDDFRTKLRDYMRTPRV